MKYSRAGLALTERFEECKCVAYWDALGKVWTIAYGHTRGVAEGLTCIQAQAEAWADEDTQLAQADVNSHVTVELTQGEFDALVDFSFNLGCGAFNDSTLLKDLNAGDYAAAANQFQLWDHAGGQVVAGLLRRRLAEENEFKGIQPGSVT